MTDPEPPIAPTEPVESEHHGERRVDPYAWLRADNWREAMADPAQLPAPVRDYLEAENAYAAAALAPARALRERLFAELKGRIREDDSSVPLPHGPWAYYLRYREHGEDSGQHPLVCRCPRDGGAGDEQVLLDGDALAAGHAYFRLVAAAHGPDHRRLACAFDYSGAETCSVRVLDLDDGAWLGVAIEQAQGDLAWSADGRHLFYTVLDDEHRPRWVHRRDLVTGADARVHEETDPGFFVGVDETESGRFVLIASRDPETTEIRALPADDPTTAPRCLLPRTPGVEYGATDHDDRWVIVTNSGGADDFRVVTAPLDDPAQGDWRELVAHRPGVLVQSVLDFRDYLVRLEIADALPRIVVRRWSDGAEHTIAFDEAGYDLDLVPGYEYATATLRLAYGSLTTPDRVYDYDMATGTRELRKAEEIPSGHDPAHYVARRLSASAPDGAEVPISLLHHRDVTPGPDTPLLLHAYGAYGLSELPAFSPHRLSLVNRGFVYAIAHVRGGKEKGDGWYRAGKLAHKDNSFGDCIACAEALVAAGCTGAGRIALHGGSAGGMLVGAVLNRRPELFHAAVADVPFVDVLNTMLDPGLPLTPPEWPEWGNPIEDPEAYRTIRGYSPYDNVRAQAYPHLLVTAGVSDPRVTYWEPAKWVARLRATRTDEHLLVLRTNMSAGHAGAAGRFDHLEEIAFRHAFLLQVYDRLELEPLPAS
ncbi:MAG: S9 family peptidase [Halofilum sp. (in: g-proteobacteria)]|nr:S9 family peptidase [Halofilum sp. (in: g-proteobacteria)]